MQLNIYSDYMRGVRYGVALIGRIEMALICAIVGVATWAILSLAFEISGYLGLFVWLFIYFIVD